uniref:Uncharacterized protein n=1 Tax=Tanacetum cinerariifolium TaxID=118510 RepID=A0A6L2ML42_TANCI|nr:hypothetical protein [Tanacetum cinerariifolium]
MPYRIYEKLGRDQVKPVTHIITMVDHSKAESMGILKDVLCQVGVTTILAKFLLLDILVERCAEEIKAMLEIKVYEMGGEDKIFSSEAWRRTIDINETIYVELFHKFYFTYEFDKVVTDEELMNKKLMKFRLAGHGHSLTLLEFSRRLGLYISHETRDRGFKVYFHGGLRNKDHFNANEYWLSISSEEICLGVQPQPLGVPFLGCYKR